MENIRIMQLIEPYIKMQPDAPALIGADGQVLTYQQLDQAVLRLTEALSRQGVKVNQRIAAVMNTGIEMALSFLAVSNVAALVPLSPDYSEDQYRYYYKLLKIDYLLIPEGYDNTCCIKTAGEMNIPVLYLNTSIERDKTTYDITGGITGENPFCLAQNEDIALVLFTSGTTSQPKIVPRSHRNIYWVAQKRKRYMALNPADRVLFTFPIFRGISINDTLSILSSGGTVIYTERPRPDTFFTSMETTVPTWILGSPVLLHSLAEYAEKNNTQSHCQALRAIRSSGAPLSEELAARLEKLFHVPVYEGYGMTETGNISSTQNSPHGFRAGSVGVPDKNDVGIMNENGQILGSNVTGEIVVRGPQVIKGYDNETADNKSSFYGEWFRTGDSGYFDDDGYLYINGRYKEIINRGGEKVSPYEVEAAISRHPDVLQAIVFPIPAGNGNEDVGAALIIREETKLYLKDLRRFLNGRIAAVKMPSSLYILKEMPSSDASKVQRKILYEQITTMGIAPQPFADANDAIILPRTATETKLYRMFQKILPVKQISVTDTFFELGGDSLKAVILFEQIDKIFGRQIPITYIIRNSSIEDLAEYLTGKEQTDKTYNFAVPFQVNGQKLPIFFVHAADGTPVVCMNLAKDFDPDRPFYSFHFNHRAVKWSHPITFEQIASHYKNDIRAIQPQGPYIIAGHCLGGILAYEIARQIRQEGKEIGLLALFDPILGNKQKTPEEREKERFKEYKDLDFMGRVRLKARKIKIFFMVDGSLFLYKNMPNFMRPALIKYLNPEALLRFARRRYVPNHYSGNMIYFQPEQTSTATKRSIENWRELNSQIAVITLKGDHGSMFSEKNAWYTRNVLNEAIEQINNH